MVSKINRSILLSFLFLWLATGNIFAAETEKTMLEQVKEIAGKIVKTGFNFAKIAIPIQLLGDALEKVEKYGLNSSEQAHITAAGLALIAIPCAIHSIKKAYSPNQKKQEIAQKSYWQGIKNGIHSTLINMPRSVMLICSAVCGVGALCDATSFNYQFKENILLALACFIMTYTHADSLKHAS